MRILLTNDDGIHAPGLVVLQEIARELSDDVWVVAPELDQSGASHAITLRSPLRMRELSPKIHAVTGTPTDCVIMGVRHLLKDQVPTLVLSGVNRGANMAEDVTYSGTIAGAMEGTLLGIRSIAMSLATGFGESRDPKWETALAHGPGIVKQLLDGPWQPGTLMNVNFPDRLPEEVGPIEVTRQGRRDQEVLQIDERADTWGTPYYWFGFARKKSNPPPGTDLLAIYEGRISVTPLVLDLTDRAALEPLAHHLGRPPKV
jgi:5'-nucleotidase